jgi:plastocyanin
MKTLVVSTLLVLAVAACGGSGSSTSPSGAPVEATAQAVSAEPSVGASAATESTAIVVKDFTLDPTDVSVAETVALAVTNDGPTIHNVTIRDDANTVLGATKDLKEGESETLTADLPAGTYVLFCSLPGHESLGIKGTLTVGS